MSGAPVVLESELQALIDAAPGLRNGNYMALATFVWNMYDWIITLDDEVEHFWSRKWTIGSYLYFANRWIAFLMVLCHAQISIRVLTESQSASLCPALTITLLVIAPFSSAVIQTILALRTYALWNCNKPILWTLMFINFAGFATQLAIGIDHGKTVRDFFNPLPPPYQGCIAPISGTDWTWQRLVPSLVFECVVAVLIMIKFADYVRERRSSRVMYVLLRDGFIEFIVITVSNIFSIAVEILQPGGGSLFMVSYDIAGTVGIIASARILLNIRDVMRISHPSEDVPGNPWGIDPITFNTMWGSDSIGSHERPDGAVPAAIPDEDWEMGEVGGSVTRRRPRGSGENSFTHVTTSSSDANLEYGLGVSSIPSLGGGSEK